MLADIRGGAGWWQGHAACQPREGAADRGAADKAARLLVAWLSGALTSPIANPSPTQERSPRAQCAAHSASHGLTQIISIRMFQLIT